MVLSTVLSVCTGQLVLPSSSPFTQNKRCLQWDICLWGLGPSPHKQRAGTELGAPRQEPLPCTTCGVPPCESGTVHAAAQPAARPLRFSSCSPKTPE